jgi:RHS repeat-associated protein
MTNGLGERIDYTLDAMGNRTAELVKSATGVIVRQKTRAFDELGRMLRDVGAAGQTWTYAYDHNGNAVTLTDPLAGATARAFDPLDRLVQETDALASVTDLARDAADNLTGVTDPRGNATTYVHDGFGRVIEEASPDRGSTVYTYDPAGNRLSRTDARGVVTDYAYDALGRLAAKSFPASPAENVTYTYDDPTPGRFAIGRLSRIDDASGATEYAYDDRGNTVRETRTIGGIAYVTEYAHDLADNLVEITYPSGRIVSYARDAHGRVTAVTTKADAVAPAVTVATNIAYLPFGPIASFDFGNGQSASFSYDQDYRLTAVDTTDGFTPAQNLALAHDAAGNVAAITDLLDAARTQSFGYDALHRLTDATGAYGDISYAYDPVGNRLTRTILDGTSTTETYTYPLDSNRLLSVTDGTATRSLAYDPAGNAITDNANGLALTYNDANRLAAVDAGAVQLATYLHNALGERVAKQAGSAATHYHYDRDGILLAESDATGAATREHIHLAGLPLALIADAGGTPALQFVHTDHLGTPQKMTDTAGQVVWDARFRPFGEAHALTGPAANDNRFPGQRLDGDTGFHYNYFRDYDPTIGRYLQSDPIGLAGGLNVYAYIDANPVNGINPLGLFSKEWHNELTMEAARRGGFETLARILGYYSMAPDAKRDSLDIDQAHKHGMCEPGEDPAEGTRRTNEYIEEQLQTCTLEGLGNALHAEQDKYSPPHRGCQEWKGGYPTPRHVWRDGLPGANALNDAFIASRDIIRRFKGKCTCVAGQS